MVAPASRLLEREREEVSWVRERGIRERDRGEDDDKVWRLAEQSSPEPSRVPALSFFLFFAIDGQRI
jgi:hypothetical protein